MLRAPPTAAGRAAEEGGFIALRHGFNPNLDQLWFVVPSLAGTLTMFIALIVTSLSIAREREIGTFEQLLVSPATPLEIVIAKTFPGVAIGSLLGAVMILVAVFGFGVPFTGSALTLAAVLPLFILSVVGLGLMVSAVSTTQQQAILGTFAFAVPMVLMSGFATPVENMPPVLQWLAEAIPLKQLMVVVHGCFLKGLSAAQIGTEVVAMSAIACVTLAAAMALVRRRLT